VGSTVRILATSGTTGDAAGANDAAVSGEPGSTAHTPHEETS
jgi:hypothetical protein